MQILIFFENRNFFMNSFYNPGKKLFLSISHFISLDKGLLFFVFIGGFSNSLKAQALTINPRSGMVLNGNVSLVINNAALKNNGSFAAGSSTVKFSGYNDTLISYLAGTSPTTFNNLSVSTSAYGVALKSAAIVTNILAVNAGNLYTDSNLTLRSDANLTARVAPVASSSYIIGKANVERYISARRAWRLMTAPVTNSNTIYNSWQNRGNYIPGLGLLVSGPNAGCACGNGLDTSYRNNVSMKQWNYNTQAFAPILNTHVLISPGNNGSADNTGYFIFTRGDRDPVNTNVAYFNSSTVNSIGVLQTGTQTFPASPVLGKYTLVGNPYASPIDFNNVSRSNLIKRFYVWDAALNAVGGYVMLDDLDNDGIYNMTVPASTQTKDIQSSQAFFVQTLADGAANITFNESGKSGFYNSSVFRPATDNKPTGFRMGKIAATLNLLNADNTTILADGTFAEFDNNFSASVDLDDALKFGNVHESFSIVRNSIALTAERRPALGLNDTIYLKLATTTQRSYQFVFESTGLTQTGMTGFLEDSYLRTSSPVSLSGLTKVNFSINAASASSVTNRFKIVFKQDLSTLPVTISSIKAYQQNSNIAVEWKVENEINMLKYDVEKSTDGIVFAPVNTTNIMGGNNAFNSYSWLDFNAVQGNNFYRIKLYDLSGEVKYSSVVKVVIAESTSGFAIYPNPINGNVINLIMSNQPVGKYQVKLTNTIGQVIFVKTIQNNGGNSNQSLKTATKLIPGVYQLEITGKDNSHNTQKVIVE